MAESPERRKIKVVDFRTFSGENNVNITIGESMYFVINRDEANVLLKLLTEYLKC